MLNNTIIAWFTSPILLNVFGGILAGLVLIGLQKYKEKRQDERDFSEFGGEYKVYNKYEKNDETRQPVFEIAIKVQKNVFELEGNRFGEANEKIKGIVVLSRNPPNHGNGSYWHATQGWGFIELQITGDKEIHTHHKWAKDGAERIDPYEWKKYSAFASGYNI